MKPNIANNEELNELLDDCAKEKPKYLTNTKEWLEERADYINSQQGYLNRRDGIECLACGNKGYRIVVRKYDEDDENCNFYVQRLVVCECRKSRDIKARQDNAGLGKYANMTLADFKTDTQFRKDMRKKASEYIEQINKGKIWWFASLGQSGAGKTLLSSVIANEIIKGSDHNLLLCDWNDFIGKFKRDTMSKNTLDASNKLEGLKNVDVLVLDEILKYYTEADVKTLAEIINTRYSNNLITIITSERTIQEIHSIDASIAGRIAEKTGTNFMVNIYKDVKKDSRINNMDKLLKDVSI